MNTMDAGDDPRGMLDLIDSTRRTTIRRLTRRYVLLYVVWAVAWAVGFGALWITQGVGALDVLPTVLGWIVFAASLIIAIVWSAIVGIRAGSDGIRGRSQLQGMLYGFSWTISMIAAAMLIAGLQRNGLSQELANVLYPGLYVFLVGVLYLSGGALFRTVPMYIVGALLIVTAVVATFVGAPNHYLVYATIAPAAMLIAAVVMLRTPHGSPADDADAS